MSTTRKLCFILVSTLIFATSACKVSSTYKTPEVETSKLFRDTYSIDSVSLANKPWNTMFTDSLLVQLIEEGIQNNLDIKIALARIKTANANLRQSKLAFFPSVNGVAQSQFQRLSNSTPVGFKELYQLELTSTWEADIWGKLKNTKKSNLAALLQSQSFKRLAQTQLVSSICLQYYQLLALDKQVSITRQTIEYRKKVVEIVKLLKESNVVNGAAVVQSEANLYSAELNLPDLLLNIRTTENSMSVLLGRSPDYIKRGALEKQQVDTTLQTGIPFLLLSNRPDVQIAEYTFRKNFALTNVAKAYFYPQLTIGSSAAGFQSTDYTKLIDPGNFFGTILGGLTQPIFAKGINTQRLRTAEAQQEESMYNYKKTLLTAGQEVSNALFSFETATDKIILRRGQLSFLQRAVEYNIELLRYTSTTNYTDVLTAEQNYLAAQLSGVNDKQQQLQSIVNLYIALGGGWR